MRVLERPARAWLAPVLAAALAVATLLSGCGTSGSETAAVRPNCPPVGHPPQHHSALTLGLNSVWNDDCDLAAIAAAGVTMERIEIDWSSVEPSQGHWQWGNFDKWAGIAARHGITLLPLLMGNPGWAAGDSMDIAGDPAGFADYVAHVVARYGPKGDFWRSNPEIPYRPAVWFELWNEPYLPQFSSGGPVPGPYAQLVKTAVTAGRKANPAAKFLLSADTTGTGSDGQTSPWVDPMYSAVPDLNNYFDGVAVHPYSAPQSPQDYTPGGDTHHQFRRIEELHQSFIQHGAGAKPFWITEVGWPTCPSDPESCVSEAKQAQYLSEMFDIVKKSYSGWVRAVFIYNYRDPTANRDPADKERWFGLIHPDGSPKPAWQVLQAAARD